MMASYKTLKGEEAAVAVGKVKGWEPLVVDGQLTAIIAGPLRIYADKGQIIVSEQEDFQP